MWLPLTMVTRDTLQQPASGRHFLLELGNECCGDGYGSTPDLDGGPVDVGYTVSLGKRSVGFVQAFGVSEFWFSEMRSVSHSPNHWSVRYPNNEGRRCEAVRRSCVGGWRPRGCDWPRAL